MSKIGRRVEFAVHSPRRFCHLRVDERAELIDFSALPRSDVRQERRCEK